MRASARRALRGPSINGAFALGVGTERAIIGSGAGSVGDMAMVAVRLLMVWLVVVAALGAAVGLGVRACATDREPLAAITITAAPAPPAPPVPPADAKEAPVEIVHIAEPIDHLRSARDREVARIALEARAAFVLADRGWTEIHHRVERVLHLDDGDDIALVSSLGSHELIKHTLVTAVVVRNRRVHSMVRLGNGVLEAWVERFRFDVVHGYPGLTTDHPRDLSRCHAWDDKWRGE